VDAQPGVSQPAGRPVWRREDVPAISRPLLRLTAHPRDSSERSSPQHLTVSIDGAGIEGIDDPAGAARPRRRRVRVCEDAGRGSEQRSAELRGLAGARASAHSARAGRTAEERGRAGESGREFHWDAAALLVRDLHA